LQIKKISILGLGLIGGSIAKAVKAAGENIAISAFDKKHRVLQKAKRENIIDEILKSVEDSINSDLIILAMPVDKSLEAFETLLPLLTRKNIITDVCGIKNIFEEKRNNIESQGHYIGAHPMAGNEASGYENSDPGLFKGTKYIISSFATNCSRIKDFQDFIELLGAKAVFLNPEIHDKIVARISHMPQLMSVALMNTIDEKDSTNCLEFAGPDFKDMTRLASSPFTSWKSILKYNREEIITAIEKLHFNLTKIEDYLQCEDFDSIEKMFRESKSRKKES